VGLCVGAVDGDVAQTKCFGTKGPTTSAAPDEHTLFRIASVSKTFAAALFALRLDQGKVKLHQHARSLVPLLGGQPLFPTTLTLLQLADHYSGLPHNAPNAKNVNEFFVKTAGCLNTSSCNHGAPGAGYSYSNWGVSVLGQLLALHDGFADGLVPPWDQDNDAAITGPLGMTETKTFADWLQSDPGHLLQNRAHSGSDKSEVTRYGGPGSGLYSSAHDMLLWLRYAMGLHGPANLLHSFPRMYENVPLVPTKAAGRQIGLVWDVMSGTPEGVKCISKAGDGPDFHAQLLFAEGIRRGAFLMVNNTPKPSYRTMLGELFNDLPPTPGAESTTCPAGQG
jgi:CubicO group peptidase (beta-lactamase class C family)